MDVAEAVAAAHDQVSRRLEGEAEARREVVAVRIDQGAVGDRAARRRDDGVGRRVEVRHPVLLLVVRRHVLVTQSEVQREPAVQRDVVLQVRVVRALAHLGDDEAGELVLRARPEVEVGEVVQVVRRGPGRAAELAAVGVQAVERIGVLHLGVDGQVLVTDLEAVPPEDRRQGQARVDVERVLELRVGGLAPELRVAVDRLRRQSTRERGVVLGQPGDAVQLEHARPADGGWLLAGLGPRDAEAAVQDGVGIEDVGGARDELPRLDLDGPVLVAA